MRKHILFIQGAGDKHKPEGSGKLIAYVQQQLGSDYHVLAPDMPDPDHPRYLTWREQIEQELDTLDTHDLLIGHSLGGSIKPLQQDVRLVAQPVEAVSHLVMLACCFQSIDRFIGEKTSQSTKRESSCMTKEDTKGLIQCMYDAFNTRNIAKASEIFAPDFYSHPLKTGVEGVKKSWTSMLKAFPDARAEVLEMLVDGDKVASRTSIHGVPTLADGTQPMILEIIRVKDQRIAELWGLTNLGEVLKRV